MASYFIEMFKKQMRKEKESVLDFNNIEDVEYVRNALRKMYSIMKKARSVNIEQIQMGRISAEKHTLRKPKVNEPMTMLQLHGGGFFTGSAEEYRAFVSNLCDKLQVNAYAVNYRLVPECPFPAALDDAFSSYKWLLEEKKLPAERIFLLGDSAGGGLVLSLLHRLKKNNMPLPKCALCISPWTDLTLSNESHVTNRDRDDFFNYEKLEKVAEAYIGKDSGHNPEISPMFADFKGFPPIFLQVDSTEMLLDDSVIISEKMKEQDVTVEIDIWDGLFHAFPTFANFPFVRFVTPEFKQAVNNMKLFLEGVCS